MALVKVGAEVARDNLPHNPRNCTLAILTKTKKYFEIQIKFYFYFKNKNKNLFLIKIKL